MNYKPCSVNSTLASSNSGLTSSRNILDADFFPPNGFKKTNSLFGRPVIKQEVKKENIIARD